MFEHELAYAGLRFPDAGYQLLALYRFWNIIQYWFPNRDVLDHDWSQVLVEFIPRIALAKDKDAYQLETIALIARVTDTHANLWSAPPQLRPPAGDCQLPVTTRFIENRAVVTGYSDAVGGTGHRVGRSATSSSVSTACPWRNWSSVGRRTIPRRTSRRDCVTSLER